MVQAIMKMREDLLAYHALMTGQFKDEIKRLEELNAQLEKKLGINSTIEVAEAKAQQILNAALDKLEEVKDKEAEAEKIAKDVAARVADVQVRENIVRQKELDTFHGWKSLNDEKDAFNGIKAAHAVEIAEKQNAVNKAAADVAKQKEEVEARANKLAAALRV